MDTEIRFMLAKQNMNHVKLIIANNIEEANEKLNDVNKDDLICIIVDLNMNPEGLTDEQKQKTQAAVLTGWIWIYSCVWQEVDFQEKPIIFYSAFVNILKTNREFKTLDSKQRKKIKLINKNEYGIDDLFKEIIALCK